MTIVIILEGEYNMVWVDDILKFDRIDECHLNVWKKIKINENHSIIGLLNLRFSNEIKTIEIEED